MAENKHTKEELARLIALPLEDKVALTKLRITEFYECLSGGVYLSFSGGKDSTVLLTIARELYPSIKAMYVDTGLEFPEVKRHVKTFGNVDIIRPKKSFKQVIDSEGWVFPSKEVAEKIRFAKSGRTWAINDLHGINRLGEKDKFKQRFIKWQGLLNAPFGISETCCDVMKKATAHSYEKANKTRPILGTMTEESALRRQGWLRTGCNSFKGNKSQSKPMSFWTEQDVLRYIKEHNIAIPSVYGDIVEKNGKLYTTGEDRTGCVFCLIGCHLEKGDRRRFVRLAKTHPSIYKYCMEQLGMKEILDYIQEYTGCEKLYV